MILTKSKKPTLIADVELMLHLQTHQSFPKEGLQLRISDEQLAKILFTCYISIVQQRNRDFIRTPELEDCVWNLSRVLTTPSHRFGILLHGNCGNGKTTMLYALRRTLFHLLRISPQVFPKNINLFSGVDVISAKGVLEGMVYSNHEYMHQDILMIDDLGHEPTEVMHYGMIHTPIIDLLEKRYARQKVTILSSNLTLEQIAAKYRNRIADRLEEMMFDIEFAGGSFRL